MLTGNDIKLRVGILGLGSIGMRHAKNILWQHNHEVFGFDPDETQQALLGSYGGHPASRDTVLACDRVVIASPTPNHYEDLKATKQNSGGVLVEKPIADRFLDFTLDHVKLVGYNLRYHSCVKQAKNWLEANFIGKPLNGHFVLAQFNSKPDYLRDGVTINWSHEIDLCLHLLGPAELISSINKNNTISNLFLEHENGCASCIHLNYLNKREERYFDILGDRGKIRCVLSPYRSAECFTEDGSVFTYNYDSTWDEDYLTEIKNFLGGDIGPGCTASEGLQVLKICLNV